MAESFPVSEFHFTSRTGTEISNSDITKWQDIKDLTLVFGETNGGTYLVTLTVPDTWNDQVSATGLSCGARFRLILRQSGTEQELAQGAYTVAMAGQRVPFSLVCRAQLPVSRANPAIVAQWQAVKGGTAWIGKNGLCALSAVGQAAAG
jgi:hypothetical protein